MDHSRFSNYAGGVEALNYHHLFYFWTVAREGGVSRASEKLNLAPSTVSGQLHQLEDALGHKLVERQGRGIVITDVGRMVLEYADDIFAVGREMLETLRGAEMTRPARVQIGIADVLPKLVARKLLEPVLDLKSEIVLVCKQDDANELLSELALHRLDLVLVDAPVGPHHHVRAYNHLLGETQVELVAIPEMAKSLRDGFPLSLDGAPLLLPGENTSLRQAMRDWFDRHGTRPRVVGEFDDSALLKTFGQHGLGVFAVHSVAADEVCRQYQVERVGVLDGVLERFYAVSVERRIKHPAVLAISEGHAIQREA
ncbi:MAG: transcriptional activator NhaR [Myxococcota bacterium]